MSIYLTISLTLTIAALVKLVMAALVETPSLMHIQKEMPSQMGQATSGMIQAISLMIQLMSSHQCKYAKI